MITKESLQESEYLEKGAYHRRALKIPFHPACLRYGFALNFLLNNSVRNLRGCKCLDFGGGDGAMSSLISDHGGEVTVFDLSSIALKLASSGDSRLKLVQGKTMLPFPDQHFGLAVMLETLEHIPDDEEMEALQEVRRVLAPNESFVVSVPSAKNRVSPKHYRHYQPDELQEKIEQVGFSVISSASYRELAVPWHDRRAVGRAVRGLAYMTDWMKRKVTGVGLVECTSSRADCFIVLAKAV